MTEQHLHSPEVSKLGVFDSGLGGLTVLAELLEKRPTHDYVYFGDTAHVPYGSREADNVIALVTEIAHYLVGEGCHGLILACNTSSALALDRLREVVSVPILGVIETAATQAAKVTCGQVAVLANPLTASSGVYARSIAGEANRFGLAVPKVEEIGCPELVSIVEEDRLYTSEARAILQSYADRLKACGTDTLVLGCTHYPLLLPVLEPLLDPKIVIVNPAELIPVFLAPEIAQAPGEVEFKVSGPPRTFNESAGKLLNRSVSAEQVLLSKTSA